MVRKNGGRVKWIGGRKFLSSEAAHYYSEDGKFFVVHVFRGLAAHQWELYEREADDDMAVFLEGCLSLTELSLTEELKKR